MARISSYQVATRLQFGVGASGTVGQEVLALGRKHPLIVTDKGVVDADLLEGIQKSLAEAGVAATVFDEVLPNPRTTNVNQAVRTYQQSGCDMLVAIGGGSVIDCAKATGVVVSNGGQIEDFAPFGTRPIEKRIPPLVAIPTTAGTGSEASTGSVISDPDRRTKLALSSLLIGPTVGLLDPELTRTLPPAMTAGCGLDALSHGIERYTATDATPLTDSVALSCIRLVAQNLRQAYANGNNLEARTNMLWAALLGGMARASVTSAHVISMTLGALYDIPHGLGCAILQPHAMAFNLIANPQKFAAMAEAMGERTEGLSVMDAAHRSVIAVERLLADVGVTQRLRDFHVPEQEISSVAESALRHRKATFTRDNPRQMTAADIEALLRRCY